ncbi:MAG: hypothetical protein HYV60_16980 [Planctomycetia bacterium]|nr:hypothetical protein [Planctomycetia bacterium]
MPTSQEPLRTELHGADWLGADWLGADWHEAMAEFRARAQRLFKSQQDRMNSLEASIAEQLGALDQAVERSQPNANRSNERTETTPEELEEARNQLAQCRKLLNARASELKQLRSLLAEHADTGTDVDVGALLEQLSELRLEKDELIGRLADAERQVEQASAADSAHFDELQRRFEVAVQEIRELKAKNADLQKQAAQGGSARATTTATTTEFDWEQQKRRLMQELDSELDESDPKDKQTKISIESTIRITDQVIADKDRQIAELKERLTENANRENADATLSILDNDAQIREERERLSRLEDGWRGKVRRAEIEISVERAKLARERSEVEAKLRSVEESRDTSAAGKTSSKQSGRWLTRLGLKDDEK